MSLTARQKYQEWRWPLAVFGLALAGGVVAGVSAFHPLTAGLVAVSVVLGIFLVQAHRLDKYFLLSLGVVLTGYAFIGRGFAYAGIPPLFIGEMVLGLGVLALLVNIRRWRFGAVEFILLVFMLLGAIATVPYLFVHGVDALRDAVLWGYATFALAVAWLIRGSDFRKIIDLYGYLLPWFIVWVPFAMLAGSVLGIMPTLPGSDQRLLPPKGGDLSVHLAGAAAFLIAGLWVSKAAARPVLEFVIWPVWLIAIAVAGSINRGGLVAAMSAVSLALVLSPSRRIATAVLAGTLLLTTVIAVDPTVDLGRDRELSVDQITTNVMSLFTDTGVEGLEGTREWRTRWWDSIIDYTFRGEYFWTGKGFGVNLAQADGFTLPGDPGLRSPHNGHMSILARMGVPGFVAWVALQSVFGITVLNALIRSYRTRDAFWGPVLVVIFCYWLAMLINASFDVYLEGPQGGIWFWAVFGLGLAGSRLQREHPHQPDTDLARKDPHNDQTDLGTATSSDR